MNAFEFDHRPIFFGRRIPEDAAYLVIDTSTRSFSLRPELANDGFVDIPDGQRPHRSKLPVFLPAMLP